eukprot:c23522_g1_i1 orf=401-1378(+)
MALHGCLSLFLTATFALHLQIAQSLPTMAPAFVWSDSSSFNPLTHSIVDYRIFSPQSLMEALLQKFGWSQILSSKVDTSKEQRVELLLAFIGSQLHSVDLSHNAGVDSELIRQLKDSFATSNFSVAIPYVSLKDEELVLANILLSTLRNSIEFQLSHGKVLVAGSCLEQQSLDISQCDEGRKFVVVDEDIEVYLNARKETRTEAETDILLVCTPHPLGLKGERPIQPEGLSLSKILSALRNSGTSHSVLYASDPTVPKRHNMFKGRQLASNTSSTDTSCDEVCKTKATLIEVLLVGIVLLIILISGLCCMMGIDTPTRFEVPQES